MFHPRRAISALRFGYILTPPLEYFVLVIRYFVSPYVHIVIRYFEFV
nr:MAG TPA: Scaffolding protein [Caudoviricetes sp.]DAR53983.1 MAG TPA: Scaffolding protein [Caudoviricetes sp.]